MIAGGRFAQVQSDNLLLDRNYLCKPGLCRETLDKPLTLGAPGRVGRIVAELLHFGPPRSDLPESLSTKE